MVNEQFTWLTPRSQQEQVGLPGLTDDTTFHAAPSSHDTKGTKLTKPTKSELNISGFSVDADVGPTGRRWQE